jgi:hypothetical protein
MADLKTKSLSIFVALLVLMAASIFIDAGHAAAQGRAQGEGRAQAATPPPPPQAGHPSGKLVIWGDVALFERPGTPNNCILTNRFMKGQRVGFRMTAIDGGSGEVENTAVLTVHLAYAGKTVDIPMRWRGGAGAAAPPPRGYLRPPVNLWTGFWVVPDDASTGVVTYTVTATDRFGRTATFVPFSYETSQITIISS